MNTSATPETLEEARRLMDAIDKERRRQGLKKTDMTGNTAYSPATYGLAINRGKAIMTTFIAFCDQLDIQIVLVNKEGEAIT